MDYRAVAFLLAGTVYGAFGSPTPSSFGMPEIIVGILLAIAVGADGAQRAINSAQAGRWYLLYGLSVTLLLAVMNGHGAGLIARDVVPFLFLFLPLFLGQYFRERLGSAKLLVGICIYIGVIFSLRSIYISNPQELLYLENMPTVLFAALYLLGLGFVYAIKGGARHIAISIMLSALAVFPVLAMAQAHQRASLGTVIIYLALIAIYFFVRQPIKTCVIAAGVFAAACGVGVMNFEIWQALSEKSQAVGMNMRPQEAKAVWQVITANPLTFLFGIGWGGHFHSPAVGGVNVNFTHNFFTSVLLKSGFSGLVLAGGYILNLLYKLSQTIRLDPVFGFALCAPVLIDLTLYASFKSLDFRLMLLMICVADIYLGNSRNESAAAEKPCADPQLCS